MDGLVFLEKIMTLRPMPVVMVSSLTQKGADTAHCRPSKWGPSTTSPSRWSV